MDLNQLSTLALSIEKLGIVGILALIAATFIYLYIKEIRHTTKHLDEITRGIKELIDNQKENQRIFLEVILKERKKDG